jgi:hypothetical protein
MLTSMVILSVIALLFAIPIILQLRQRQQRAAALRRAGDELGFLFSPGGDADTLTGLSSSYLFSQGTKKRSPMCCWASARTWK